MKTIAPRVVASRHAPGEQVLHRGGAHGTAESLEECRAREGCLFRQLCDRPRLGRTFMHPPYRGRQASIGKPAHEARRRLSPRRRSEGFDEKNLQKACEDDIPRRPQLAGFFAHELHEGGQPPLTANVDELRQERNQQGRVRRTKCAVANQQSYVGLPVLNADSELAMGQQCNGYGLEVIRRCRSQQLLAKPSALRSNRAISLYARKLLIAHRKFDDSRRG